MEVEQKGSSTVATGVLQGLNPSWTYKDQQSLSVDEAVGDG